MFSLFKKKKTKKQLNLVSLADGKIIDITTVSDELFSQQILGKIIAFCFEGSSVEICSPADGVLSVVFDTGHAFGITTNQGLELLIHIGIDTVNEQGKGFTTYVHQGDSVKQGDILVAVDYDYLAKKYDTSTMLIITSSEADNIEFIGSGNVKKGQSLLKIN